MTFRITPQQLRVFIMRQRGMRSIEIARRLRITPRAERRLLVAAQDQVDCIKLITGICHGDPDMVVPYLTTKLLPKDDPCLYDS